MYSSGLHALRYRDSKCQLVEDLGLGHSLEFFINPKSEVQDLPVRAALVEKANHEVPRKAIALESRVLLILPPGISRRSLP